MINYEAGKAFLSEYVKLCARYKLCLAHEDRGGAFIINELNTYDLDWVLAALHGGAVDAYGHPVEVTK